MLLTNIELYAYDYLEELRNDKDYKRVIEINNLINNDFCEEVKKFKVIKEKYEDVSKYGNHHPDFKDVTEEFIEIRTNLYKIKEIKEYLELTKKIDKQLASLVNDMALNISKNIPTLNIFGFSSIGGICNGC